MLVEKKFIFISLPRCASTSFHISCLKRNFNLEFVNPNMLKFNKEFSIKSKSGTTLNNEEIADNLLHYHESILSLKEKFGNSYPIIAIKRNNYETFISLYKHIIDEFTRIGEINVVNKLKKLSTEDILFFNTDNILTIYDTDLIAEEFLKKFQILNFLLNPNSIKYTISVFNTLFKHPSHFHNNASEIIWFDIKKLNELEDWVVNITGKEFKIEKINSSKKFKCNLKLDSRFKQKYDEIYGVLDNRQEKIISTII